MKENKTQRTNRSRSRTYHVNSSGRRKGGNSVRYSGKKRNSSQGEQRNVKNRKTESNGRNREGAESEAARQKETARRNDSAGRKRLNTRNRRDTRRSQDRPVRKKAENVKVFPIGGLDEIGKNMTCLQYRDQILIIDCGMSFPEDEMFGIDVVIPDFTFVTENADKVKGLIITHGHEDHIGGVPYLLKKINVPIYGTRLSIGLIRSKLEEHGIQGDLHTINAGDQFNLGDFRIEAIHTTHSIADSLCYCIETPAARIFHTGDFKIDYTPVDGDPIDFAKLAEIGTRGVDLMLADSTNVLRPGYTPSERVVGKTLDGIFREAKNRIIIATFSSNVRRVQMIIELAVKYGRKFTVSGRSMEKVLALAIELGYVSFPDDAFVDLKDIRTIPDHELVIITTGSQGEPMSALTRIARGEHRNIKLKKGDTVVLSSSPVPGNEKMVSNVVNQLFEKEVDVIYNSVADIHVSGHACQGDLMLMHSLIKPKFFMPAHGEHRHLVRHQQLAEELGMKEDHIFILGNGDQLTVDHKKAIQFRNVVSAEDVLVDGLGVGDIGSVVLKDRKTLSESGLVVVSAAVDLKNGVLLSGPEIVTRGFVYVKENEDLINQAKDAARKAIVASLDRGTADWATLKSDVRDALRKFIYSKTQRSPMILPIFLDE
ncbi:MAG: ribonuclease J [Anaerovoracaceae bacterium]|jgi:ribonuclease J